MMPSGSFNPQMTPDDIQRASFVTRLYGRYNQRGPYLYPQSPYDLLGMGDIAPMSAMQPVDADTLFTQLPTEGLIATSTAPIGSAGYPTFLAASPSSAGTTMGPSGATVPFLGPNGSPAAALAAPAYASGIQSAMPNEYTPRPSIGPTSYTSSYGVPPAGTPNQSIATGQPVGPVSFMNPWPSIISPPPASSVPGNATDSFDFGCWVNQNPGLAVLGTLGVYLLLRGGRKRK
jgi:hypothetical protein